VIWLDPVAFLAVAAVAAPILIHLLAQRRAERLAFPTLRFLQPTRLAAIRRRLIDDVPLLAVRVAAIALAAAALAGPLIVTSSRRDAWSRRVVRAIVSDEAASPARAAGATRADAALHLAREFRGGSLSDGIRRAVEWLEHAPPAKRELLIVSPLTIGAISQGDIALVPADVGIAFERSRALPVERTVPFGRLVTATEVVSRTVTLAGDRTSVHDTPAEIAARDAALPIDVVSRAETKPILDAALDAVLSQRVWLIPPGPRVRAVFDGIDPGAVEPLRRPWMADAVARLTGDRDLQDAASRSTAALRDPDWTRAPWHVVALAGDGRPLVAAAAGSDALIVASGGRAADLLTPILLRALAAAIAKPPEIGDREIVPIADGQLRAWSRSAGPPPEPRTGAVDDDDRRWFWIGVLTLLLLEGWLRRTPRRAAGGSTAAEAERVA